MNSTNVELDFWNFTKKIMEGFDVCDLGLGWLELKFGNCLTQDFQVSFITHTDSNNDIKCSVDLLTQITKFGICWPSVTENEKNFKS